MIKRSDAIIFEMGHKPWEYTDNALVTPMQLGAKGSEYDICPIKDNIGEDNISALNYTFGEMSGVYWVWKNIVGKGYKYVGQTTYRRKYEIPEDFNFEEAFKQYDVIMSNVASFPYKAGPLVQFAVYHNYDDIRDIINIIKKKYPDYEDAAFKFIASSTMYNTNGFIMKDEDYDKYCKFAFGVLFEYLSIHGLKTMEDINQYVQRNYDEGKYLNYQRQEPTEYVAYQQRLMGFLGERLLNIFIIKNFAKIAVVKNEDNSNK